MLIIKSMYTDKNELRKAMLKLRSQMDEQEYEIAADAFDEYLDTLDFDALLGSDDE